MKEMAMSNRQLSMVSALGVMTLGGAAGFVAGWLSAPASGRETRRRIGRRIDDERREALRLSQRAINHAFDRMERGLESGRLHLNRTFAA
jgi:gas vesicle protein